LIELIKHELVFCPLFLITISFIENLENKIVSASVFSMKWMHICCTCLMSFVIKTSVYYRESCIIILYKTNDIKKGKWECFILYTAWRIWRQNSKEIQTSIYNEAECITVFYKIFCRNVEERITLKKWAEFAHSAPVHYLCRL